jgi:SulP family sulfate permease
MAELTRVRLTGTDEGTHEVLPAGLRQKVAIYDIAGPLFFGAAQKAMASLGAIAGRIQVVIIRLDSVPVMDATGLVALESAIAALTRQGCVSVLAGLQAQPAALLERAGFKHRPWRLVIRPDLPSALEAAEEIVRAEPRKSSSHQLTVVDQAPGPPRS